MENLDNLDPRLADYSWLETPREPAPTQTFAPMPALALATATADKLTVRNLGPTEPYSVWRFSVKAAILGAAPTGKSAETKVARLKLAL